MAETSLAEYYDIEGISNHFQVKNTFKKYLKT